MHFDLVGILTEHFEAHPFLRPGFEGITFFTEVSYESLTVNRLVCRVSAHFQQDEKPLIDCGVACEFWVEETTVVEYSLVLRREEAYQIAALTIGVLRGALHAKTEGTAAHDLHLPLINMAEMISGEIQLPIPSQV